MTDSGSSRRATTARSERGDRGGDVRDAPAALGPVQDHGDDPAEPGTRADGGTPDRGGARPRGPGRVGVADHPEAAGEHGRPAQPLDEPGGDDDPGMTGRPGDGRGRAEQHQAGHEDPPPSAVVGEHACREQGDREPDAHRAEHPGQAGGPGVQGGRGAHAGGQRGDEGEQHEDGAPGREREHVPRSARVVSAGQPGRPCPHSS